MGNRQGPGQRGRCRGRVGGWTLGSWGCRQTRTALEGFGAERRRVLTPRPGPCGGDTRTGPSGLGHRCLRPRWRRRCWGRGRGDSVGPLRSGVQPGRRRGATPNGHSSCCVRQPPKGLLGAPEPCRPAHGGPASSQGHLLRPQTPSAARKSEPGRRAPLSPGSGSSDQTMGRGRWR